MIPAAPEYPPLVHVHRHADNGFAPDDGFYGHVTAAMAHTVAFRRKLVYRRVCALGEPGGITGTPWRWHCRAGVGAVRFIVYAVLGLDDRNLAADPYITVAITKVSGPTTTSMDFHGGASTRAATDAPEEFSPGLQVMDAVAGEVYTGAVTFADNVRVIALLVWEDAAAVVTEANHPHSEWTPSAGSPIYDAYIENELDGVGDLIRYNGGLRADWHMVDGTARTRTSATLINLIDNTSTGNPTASTPGFTFNTQYRNTISKTTVPIVFAVYGSIAAGSGTVKLVDTSGNVAATLTINSATPQWFTVAGAISASSSVKYDIQYAGDGANAVSVLAVSIYEEG